MKLFANSAALITCLLLNNSSISEVNALDLGHHHKHHHAHDLVDISMKGKSK